MAHFDALQAQAVGVVASELASRLPTLPAAAALSVPPGAANSIRESVRVWMLGVDAVQKSPHSLRHCAIDLQRWHHQLEIRGRRVGLAQSSVVPGAPGGVAFAQVAPDSMLARAIDEGILWVDNHATGDPLVRLLVAPAYFLHAFWLVYDREDDDQVVIVHALKPLPGLNAFQLYSASDFLKNLANVPHATGIL